jgi:site-specific recombinase XerD
MAAYLDHLRTARRVSASTFEAYSQDLAGVARWANLRQLDLLGLGAQDLERYLVDRRASGIRPASLARHMSACRQFFWFLMARGVTTANPAAGIRVHLPRPVPGPPFEVRSLRGLETPRPAPDLMPVDAVRMYRDHAIVCLLAETTLGVSDVRLLLWAEVLVGERRVRVRRRNGQVRSVPMGDDSVAALGALDRARASLPPHLSTCPYCFPTLAGLPLSRQAFCQRVRRWASERGSQRVVTPTVLRQAGRASRTKKKGGATARHASKPSAFMARPAERALLQ